MEYIGLLVKKIGEREGDSQNGHWRVASFLLEQTGMYPKKMAVDVRDGVMGRIQQFEALVGKTVKVAFDIDAQEYNGRWFNKVTAFGIADYAEERAKELERAEEARKEAEQSAAVAHQPTGHQAPPADDPFSQMADNNDLPY